MLMFNVQLYKDVCENEKSNTNKFKQILQQLQSCKTKHQRNIKQKRKTI